jgi:hypothetical protein
MTRPENMGHDQGRRCSGHRAAFLQQQQEPQTGLQENWPVPLGRRLVLLELQCPASEIGAAWAVTGTSSWNKTNVATARVIGATTGTVREATDATGAPTATTGTVREATDATGAPTGGLAKPAHECLVICSDATPLILRLSLRFDRHHLSHDSL